MVIKYMIYWVFPIYLTLSVGYAYMFSIYNFQLNLNSNFTFVKGRKMIFFSFITGKPNGYWHYTGDIFHLFGNKTNFFAFSNFFPFLKKKLNTLDRIYQSSHHLSVVKFFFSHSQFLRKRTCTTIVLFFISNNDFL